MSRPAGSLGKRTQKFERLVRRLEREQKLSVELILRHLFKRAIDPNPENAGTANSAARQLLDRIVGPSVRRVEVDVEVADPITALLRELAAERTAQLTAGKAIEVSLAPEREEEGLVK